MDENSYADGPPPTMPSEARTGAVEQADPVDASADGAGGVPPGTAPEVEAALGTSESLKPVDGVHTPDIGPGGEDIDTAEWPLAGRPDAAR
ncbi:hypothetical protein [Cryptosporangium phraense]|uniref:Uncharacterized protein n=1 Tax=Cryptosporangium phraense TaxID=2593070 RepID=A0A545ASL1_9ACTN|nr:hypothetical protein [Cryptosporangium phraense]TQS44314.1 hypothetical protein FL583_15390 [Cryptosporangium phraense]